MGYDTIAIFCFNLFIKGFEFIIKAVGDKATKVGMDGSTLFHLYEKFHYFYVLLLSYIYFKVVGLSI